VSTLHVVGDASERFTRVAFAANLAAGARTWSIALLVVAGALVLRGFDHIGDDAVVWLCASALAAVGGRSSIHAGAGAYAARPASTSTAVVMKPAERATDPGVP
jgi:hypothetical protein